VGGVAIEIEPRPGLSGIFLSVAFDTKSCQSSLFLAPVSGMVLAAIGFSPKSQAVQAFRVAPDLVLPRKL
jgi:hypothetical protein